jgi:SAM-dependent methyltransferase
MLPALSRTKRTVEKTLRSAGLERVLYHWVYYRDRTRTRLDNAHFLAVHRSPRVPPARLRFDVIGATSARAYVSLGQEDARHILRVLDRWVPGRDRTRVLEWGCGPGRILGHLAEWDAARRLELHGADYYAPSVRWARANLTAVRFVHNRIHPPLPYEDGSFGFVYAISVFTHLTEDSHSRWLGEIRRILQPGGVFLFTTHGDAYRDALDAGQRADYDAGRYTASTSAVDGSQMFAAFQSPAFMRRFLAGLEVLDHEPCGWNRQDVWIVRK